MTRAEAPCTVGNFGPGFDVLSLALALRGDTVTLHDAPRDEIRVTGPGAERVPTDWQKNCAGAAIDALRKRTGHEGKLLVEIEKGVRPGSGLGSSASSSAASVLAFARHHEIALPVGVALEAAGLGEAAATGAAHHDDVAAALYGGLTIVGGDVHDPVVRLRPPLLSLVVALPDVELPTREMRALIPATLPRADVVHNLSSVARIVHACHAQDAEMLCRALDDRISKPYRAPKIPKFGETERAARDAGARAFVLCGSGPAMLAVAPPGRDADLVRAMRDASGAEIILTKPAPEVNDPAIPLP